MEHNSRERLTPAGSRPLPENTMNADTWEAIVEVWPHRRWFRDGHRWDVKRVLNGRPSPLMSEKGYCGWARTVEEAVECGKREVERRGWDKPQVAPISVVVA